MVNVIVIIIETWAQETFDSHQIRFVGLYASSKYDCLQLSSQVPAPFIWIKSVYWGLGHIEPPIHIKFAI